ncbi:MULTISPECIES: hypothetical protein [unclassified Streptomyces]|uniref:hypothetical protein n=1 Tax=unclassified Streptomyces TaxID=2593676 RepID=UPI002DDBE1C0|nr:hypothetical protein [Streptomyces sp. NBC_01445]WSE02393.1 hypothetical protein OG574_02765 [Streptomyces sp. NBC_01445]
MVPHLSGYEVLVMVGAGSSARVRRAATDASRGLSPLEALRDSVAVELEDAEQQEELWRLHAHMLCGLPDLLARSVGADLAGETGLTEAT